MARKGSVLENCTTRRPHLIHSTLNLSMCPTLENLLSLLADIAVVEPSSINFADTLSDIGLDSLDCVQFANEIDEHFEVELPETAQPEPTTTVADLHDAIQKAQAA